jgi:hypothetical protein
MIDQSAPARAHDIREIVRWLHKIAHGHEFTEDERIAADEMKWQLNKELANLRAYTHAVAGFNCESGTYY